MVVSSSLYPAVPRPESFHAKAPFGWSACKKGGHTWVVYKRDCPEPLDWVPVFRTRKEAETYVEMRKASEGLPTLEKIEVVHMWLCHSDGSPCEDGCDAHADPTRLEIYQNI